MNAAWLRVELWLVFSVMPLFNIATFTQQEVSCYSMCWYSCTADKTQDLLSVMTNCKITLMEHLCKNVYNPTAILLQILSCLLSSFLSCFLSFFLAFFLGFFLSFLLSSLLAFSFYHSLYRFFILCTVLLYCSCIVSFLYHCIVFGLLYNFVLFFVVLYRTLYHCIILSVLF